MFFYFILVVLSFCSVSHVMLPPLLKSAGPATSPQSLEINQPRGSTPLPCWANVVVGKGDDVDRLGFTCHGERRARLDVVVR